MCYPHSYQHLVTTIPQLRQSLPPDSCFAASAPALEQVTERYPMAIPPYYLSLIDPYDPDDPIARMCLPSLAEIEDGGAADTSGEFINTVAHGIQHKYSQTVLVLATNRCAMYCRYCFRKRMVGLTERETLKDIDRVASYVQEHKEVSNVLISGGDAFFQSNHVIERYLETLSGIDHLDFIRFGTKTPVVLPERIYADGELLDILARYSSHKQIYVVTQFNHPRELSQEALRAVKALTVRGIIMKNQSVMLRGVNDDAETLAALFKGLSANGIAPYYLFQCRPTLGVKNHFQVPIAETHRICEQAKARQNGIGKAVRHALSHPTGKIEVLGENEHSEMLFKYHQAKDKRHMGQIFSRRLTPDQCWLEDDPLPLS